VHNFLPIAAVILALVSAGCVAYIAWELISEMSDEDDSSNSDHSK